MIQILAGSILSLVLLLIAVSIITKDILQRPTSDQEAQVNIRESDYYDSELDTGTSLGPLELLWIAQKRPDMTEPLRAVTNPSTRNLRKAGMFNFF